MFHGENVDMPLPAGGPTVSMDPAIALDCCRSGWAVEASAVLCSA